MKVYKINPLRDPRWSVFVEHHASGSIFHTPAWLDALRRTYGYEPIVLTTSAPGEELANGLVFCRIDSWLTGRRMVSLPFSDYCEPLVDSSDSFKHLFCCVEHDLEKENMKYIEIRPLKANMKGQAAFGKDKTFYSHRLDLRPPLDKLLRSFHRNSVQRKIRRAERESLTYEVGTSESLLAKFYYLLLLTRRRHHLPPQPLDWFRNLIHCLGHKLKIHIASKDGRPVASVLTLWYRGSVVYKYGCSDPRFNNLGGMALLFWKTIQEAKDRGLQEFDLGRCDVDNSGLIAYKDRWGTTRSLLTYWRYPAGVCHHAGKEWQMQIAKTLFARIPDHFLTTAGKLLYKHIG